MSKKLTDTDVEKIADLIKIQIPTNERASYTIQLNTVLKAVDVMAEVNVDNIQATSQTHGLENVLSDDIVEEGLSLKEYPNRKNIKDKYFVVHRVIK